MGKYFSYLTITAIAWLMFFLSCKKEKPCVGCIDSNKPPIAAAGTDQVINLPADSILLDGSYSYDPDGTISSWLWTKISGPASFSVVDALTTKTIVRDLDTGVYRFELMVKDNGGLTGKDTVQIIMRDPLQMPPVADAGADRTIFIPANSVYLDGRGSTDPDYNITSFVWTRISGPSSSHIANATAVQTEVTNLVQGIYQFELKVTDAVGSFSKDTMQVDVNVQPPPPNSLCPPTNRPAIAAQLASIGELSIGRYNMATVSTGNKIFFAGGISGPGALSSRVDIYDIAGQTWSTGELSMARWHLSAVDAGNKVFFAGGYSTTGATSRVDIYDLTTQTWSTAELSQARAYIEAISVNNKVFFAGGATNGSGNSSRIDIFDISSNTWSTANLSEAKIGFTATAAGDKIYFAGGDLSNNGPASNKIDIYDNTTGSWSTATLSTPKAFHAAIFKSGNIYWAGGATHLNYQGGIGNEDLITCHVEIKDVNTQVSSIANLYYPKYFNGAFEKGSNIIIVSFYSGWAYWSDFDIYDIGSNSWSVGVLPQSLSSHASVISVNNVMYVAGGLSSFGGNLEYLPQVWKVEF